MNLLQMSVSGAVMIAVIILFRTLCINRLPKKTFLILWGVVLLRLLLPFSFPSTLSIYSLLADSAVFTEALSEAPGSPLPTQNMAGQQVNGFSPDALSENTLPGVREGYLWQSFSPSPWKSLAPWASLTSPAGPAARMGLSPLTVLWIVCMALCAAYFLLSYLYCRSKFQKALPVHNAFVHKWLQNHHLLRTMAVRQSKYVSAPLTYGILRPIILLPENTDWENTLQLQYMLEHEYIHIRRADAFWKLLMTTALCIHWFNPLVWAMYLLFNRDIELTCDESVVRHFGDRSRASYARTLISMEEQKLKLYPFCNSFHKNATEERITSIMKTKKATFLTILLAIILIIAIIILFATSAASKEDAPADIPDTDLMDPPSGYVNPANPSSPSDPSLSDTRPGPASSALSGAAPSTTLTFTIEGLTEEVPAYLFVGDGYSLYVTDDFHSQTPDAWVADSNENVQFWVTHFDDLSLEDASGQLSADSRFPFPVEDMSTMEGWEKGAFSGADSWVHLLVGSQTYKDSAGQEMMWTVKLMEWDGDTWGLFSCYPAEAEEGFGQRLPVILDTFAVTVTGEQTGQEAISMEQTGQEALMAEFSEIAMEEFEAACLSFATAYFSGNADNLTPFLSASYEDDFYQYLSLELIREEDSWKIAFYGPEM